MVDNHDGERLAALMRRAKITDAKLADETGTSVQAVGKWKRTGQIAREHIAQICRCLNASADELLGLAPIKGVAEAPSIYRPGPEREALLNAVRWTTEALKADRRELPSPDKFARLIVNVYEVIRESPQTADRGVVIRLLRAAA